MQTVGKQCYIMSNNPSFIMLNVVKKFFTLLALHEQEGRVLFGVDLISCQKWAWTQGISWTSLIRRMCLWQGFSPPQSSLHEHAPRMLLLHYTLTVRFTLEKSIFQNINIF